MGRRIGKAGAVSALDTEMEVRASALVALEADSRPRRTPRIGTHSGKVLSSLLNLVLVKYNWGAPPFCTGKRRKSEGRLYIWNDVAGERKRGWRWSQGSTPVSCSALLELLVF